MPAYNKIRDIIQRREDKYKVHGCPDHPTVGIFMMCPKCKQFIENHMRRIDKMDELLRISILERGQDPKKHRLVRMTETKGKVQFWFYGLPGSLVMEEKQTLHPVA